MSNHAFLSEQTVIPRASNHRIPDTNAEQDVESVELLPISITRAASKHTYYTIRYLADRNRVLNAYRAYAYFRWVDDTLDQSQSNRSERIEFVARQQAIVEGWFAEGHLHSLTAEEKMLLDLLSSEPDERGGLQAYVEHMMQVMTFDANRRGYLISQNELEEYSLHLATGVTEALHYFIGHDDAAPQTDSRYLAVTGAHITHMLRDTFEDIEAGYFNIPREFLESHGINASDVGSDAYREWVESRVRQARGCFAAGRRYLADVQNARCRLAGYAYTARFESVLDTIERDGYILRPAYQERANLSVTLRMARSVITNLLKA